MWRRQTAVADLVITTGLLESYIWVWRGSFALDGVVLGSALLLLFAYVHRARADSLADVLAASGSILPAARWVLIFTIPAGGLIFLAFVLDPVGLPSAPKMAARWATLVALGILQQYILLAHIYRSTFELIHRRLAAMIIAAAMFSVLHWPNVLLMIVTALAGLISCWVYDRARNIFVLGIAHGTLSWMLYYGLPRAVTEGLRIGPQLH